MKNNTALIVLDMQDYFLNKKSHAYVPGSEKIIPKINKIKNKFKDYNLPVFQTIHINTEKNAGQMSKWWQDLIILSNPLSSLHEELEDNYSYKIEKSQYDAFYNTDLENLLKQKNINQIIITGLLTHLCCETTARSAFTHNFKVIFINDATATYDKEHQAATIKNLKHGFAKIKSTKKILEEFNDL